MRALIRTAQVRTLALTTIVLAAGLALIWLTKGLIGIEGDAVFIVLLLVPVVVLLALTDKLESFQLFGASAVFRDLQKLHGDVAELGENVTEVGEREAERATYLGKLTQVLGKDGREFALIYADVDGLRRVTREIYLVERAKNPDAENEREPDHVPKRRREEEIRTEILDSLELALTDAFYDASLEHAKCDVFRLVDPDIAMIVRSVTSHQAYQIAEAGEDLFRVEKGFTATTAVLPAMLVIGEVTPKGLDNAAARALHEAKKTRSGG